MVVEEHVARLQVAVYDAKAVQVHQTLVRTTRIHTTSAHDHPAQSSGSASYPQDVMQHKARLRHGVLRCAAFEPRLHVATAAPRQLDVPVTSKAARVFACEYGVMRTNHGHRN